MRRALLTAATLMLATANASACLAAGALVDSPIMGKYYYMTHRSTPAYAAGLAMGDCAAKEGGGCQVLASWSTGCVAVAHAHDGTHHSGWAIKQSEYQATQLALAQCTKYGQPCTLDIDRCE